VNTTTLTGKQRSRLRQLAQDIDPVVMIGKNGLTDEVVKATDEALDIHELVKVRFSDFKDKVKEISNDLAAKTKSDLAGKIGHVVILFRQNSDPEKRKIRI
jgi:RNA-binding protein